MTDDSIAERKRVLRAELTARLASVEAEAAARASALASRRFLRLPEILQAERVLVCLSFGPEISTAPVVEALLASQREVYVPRADPADGLLHVHRYPCELVTLSFGLRQPARGAPEVEAARIDEILEAVLVLGLAFDEAGYRLGHGRGYFDRFLAGRRFPAIGFAYETQVVECLPPAPHDVAMAALVTETATRRFAGSPG